MNLYNLGHVSWLDSQLLYHALPRTGNEGLILLAPAEPYVCIGYHQDAAQEVDLGYCQEQNIPVFRREVGGGAVFLDGQQLFYQLVIHRDNPLVTGDKLEFYQRFLEPVVQTYRDLGVDAQYRPVNDIVTAGGRKISGNGAAEIDDYLILVGNVIVDFDYETMVRVLRVPDAKFRDKVFKSMRENLTTLKREVDEVPSWEHVTSVLVQNFSKLLDPLVPAELPAAARDTVDELTPERTTEEWLLQPGRRVQQRRQESVSRSVKIAAGVDVKQRMHKAPGGLIRTIVETQGDQIVSAGISGDFFFYPAEKLPFLEEILTGLPLLAVPAAVAEFYAAHEIESPGVTPEDLVQALGAAPPQD